MRLRRFAWGMLGALALWVHVGAGWAASAEGSRPHTGVYVPHSRQWTMRSTGNGREYAIFIAIPDGPAPKNGDAVIYVLDGNSMFLTAVEAVRAYSRRRDGNAQARAIVVGVGYPDGVDVASARAFDLTAKVSEPRSRYPSGGAEAFWEFIERELKPRIADEFPVDPDRQALMGHSLGGRFTLDVMTRKPDAFQAYVGMSPSFWFGQHDLKRRIDAFVQARCADGCLPTPLRVLLTVGEFEQQPRSEEWWRDPARAARLAEDLAQRGQMTHARHAVRQLAQLPGIKAEFQEIAGEDHGTVIPAAIGRAIRFILMDWQQIPDAAAK